MKHKLLLSAVFSGLLLLGAGCQSDTPPEDTSKIPGASIDPGRDPLLEATPGGNQGIGQWQDPASFGGAVDKDGWREADPSGNRLNMPIIYFGFDSEVLKQKEINKLNKIADYLRDKPELGLVIEGHCDQRGTEEYNRALGERRANAIRSHLVSRGVANNKIKTISYGEDKPAVTGNGESVWAKNRRGVPVPMILPR